MSLGATRWHPIAESNFAWEREALDWLRSNLPDRDSWHVWTNFEFIDDEGKVSEVDALVLSPAGLFLVEIKSRPGVLRGDAHSWTWTTDGRSNTYDNPVILANRKAKRLASLLRRQPAITKAKIRLPFVEPAIFLSSSSLSCQLEGLARTATFQHGRPGTVDDPGIVGALANGITNRATTSVDAASFSMFAFAIITACPVPSCSVCSANSTSFTPAKDSRTSSAPCPITSTILVAPAARAASTTQCTIGRPTAGCMTFGKSDCMRVPLPAARMTATRPRPE